MTELSDIVKAYGDGYLKKYSSVPLNHQKALSAIRHCRTSSMGGQVYICDECKHVHYSYHSCRNRNCNKCQNDKAAAWLEKSKALLLPVNHFMVTFTMHPELRDAARENQSLFYNVLFKASSSALEALARDTKFIGGRPAMMAVLHTWTRKLLYHPHLHFIVPGGGLAPDGKTWKSSNPAFLVPVMALSKLFRANFRKALKKAAPDIYNSLPGKIWNEKWVVHSKPVGRGDKALGYLSEYVFRPAISNYRILSHDNGTVRFKYTDSKTKEKKILSVTAEEFLRRYLQHVLPQGFVKVRYFGLFARANKKLLAAIKDSLRNKTSVPAADNATASETKKPLACASCGKPVRRLFSFPNIWAQNRAPPAIRASPSIPAEVCINLN